MVNYRLIFPLIVLGIITLLVLIFAGGASQTGLVVSEGEVSGIGMYFGVLVLILMLIIVVCRKVVSYKYC